MATNTSKLPSAKSLSVLIAFSILYITAGCGISHGVSPEPIQPKVTISLSIPRNTIFVGESLSLSATVEGIFRDLAVEWLVNGVIGGDQEGGTVTDTGAYSAVYTAPLNGDKSIIITARLRGRAEVEQSKSIEIVALTAVTGQMAFGFTLPNEARTSAGVYNLQGRLVRTLWSDSRLEAGPHIASWDGKDDLQNVVQDSSYEIRVLSNNVRYQWGVIGDTSSTWSGPGNWDSQSTMPRDMAISGSRAVFGNGYSEGRPNSSIVNLAAPQEPSPFFSFSAGWCDIFQFVTTDEKRAYLASVGTDFVGSVAFVAAVDLETREQYKFPFGISPAPSQTICGPRRSGLIDVDPDASQRNGATRTHIPTGIAVQQTGNLLAVSHGTFSENTKPGVVRNYPGEDQILLFDKLSGEQLGAIKIGNPQNIAFTAEGDLWVITQDTLVKISSVGQQNTIVNTLSGLESPRALAVDSFTGDILVADGGHSQQVKRFNSAGKLLSIFGNKGGYTDCDPTISSQRLYLDGTAGYGSGNESPGTWLAVQPDGSYWVGDIGNSRILHISSSGDYIEQIAFLRFLYSVSVDHAEPKRVFGDFLEYQVDYSKELLPGDPDSRRGGNESWSLVRNWSVCVPSKYYRLARIFETVHTFSNGHTFGTLYSGQWNPEIVELPQFGPLRFTGERLTDWSGITNEGNLGYATFDPISSPGTKFQKYYQQDLQGYSAANVPIWSTPRLLASVSAVGSSLHPTEPIGQGGQGMSSFPQPTTSGMLITFNSAASQSQPSFHLGGIKLNENDWTWKASPGALIEVPDGKGTFTDIEHGIDGVGTAVEGNNILEGYNGNHASFSNQWMHWWWDGLLIGQFGQVPTYQAPDGSLVPEAAGNILKMSTATVGGDVYLYHGDEDYHPGIHRWRISGLDTIQEVKGTGKLGGIVVLH